MTLLGLTLVIFSACFHVVAHVVLKRSLDRLASVWWVLVWGGLLLLPVLVFDPMPWSWPLAGLVLLSGFFQFAYFYSIARAYHTGDLSVVYPLARGTAPVFLLVWATVLIGERPTLGGIVGVLVIAAGIYLIGLPRRSA
ncbi:MAG: EamA family transporter, partial [Chloroflexi bacterium]|nr:EamA family transporter [Chloroflexota bacterium]